MGEDSQIEYFIVHELGVSKGEDGFPDMEGKVGHKQHQSEGQNCVGNILHDLVKRVWGLEVEKGRQANQVAA